MRSFFSAAILQPPPLIRKADDALTTVVSVWWSDTNDPWFDDEGRQFDAVGNSNWWTKEDGEKFDAHTKMIVDQFNMYYPLDSVLINGNSPQEKTLPISVESGYLSNINKTETDFSERRSIWFTAQQRFFIGFAASGPATIRRRLCVSNTHQSAQPGKIPRKRNRCKYSAMGMKPLVLKKAIKCIVPKPIALWSGNLMDNFLIKCKVRWKPGFFYGGVISTLYKI